MSFYVNNEYKGKGFARPSDDLAPVIKEKANYALSWAKFIYSSHMNGITGIPYSYARKLSDLRSYAKGRQDSNKYKKWYVDTISASSQQATAVDQSGDDYNNKLQQGRKHWMDVDFDTIFSPAPKFINYLVGKFSKVRLDAVVQAIDERSGMERERKKWMTWAEKKTEKFFTEIDAMRGLEGKEPKTLPQTLEELKLYEQMGHFKMMYEVAMEKALSFTMKMSEETKLRKKVIADIATCNIGAFMTQIDQADGVAKFMYCDPANLIVEYADPNKPDDITFFGYVEGYKVSDIRRLRPDLKEEDVKAMAKRYISAYGNPDTFNDKYDEINHIFGYDEFNVPVLYCAWKTTDKHHYTTRTNSKGEDITTYEPYDDKGRVKIKEKENRKTTAKYLDTIYETRWIIGTEYVFGNGRMHDVPFDMKNRTVKLPVHVLKLDGKSIMEQMVPLLDQIQLTYLRLQNAIAKAPPSGLKIDIGKMKNLRIGKQKLSPFDLIKIYTQTGHLLYDSSITQSQIAPEMKFQDPGKAIEELRGGVGTAIQDAINSFEMSFAAISELTGIDRASVVSRQPDRTSATETKVAAIGSSDTLFPMVDGYADILKLGAECAALRIQGVCMQKDNPYIAVLGESGSQAIKGAGCVPPVYYGINIQIQPTQEEVAEIKMAAQGAVKAGTMSFGQYMFLVDSLNSGAGLNHAMNYIVFVENQAKEQAQQAALANQEADTQKQMMLAQMKQEGDANMEMLKGKINMDTEAAKAEQMRAQNVGV